MSRGGSEGLRPAFVFLEEATRVDEEARHLLVEVHGALAAENAHLVDVHKVLEDHLRAAAALARAASGGDGRRRPLGSGDPSPSALHP